MTEVVLHTKRGTAHGSAIFPNALPQLLHTPSGLALLEIQGTINLPDPGDDELRSSSKGESGAGDNLVRETHIGKLIFPDYQPGQEGTAWMKRVYLYVGQHQRLTGEVKKLPKAVAIIRKRKVEDRANSDVVAITTEAEAEDGAAQEPVDELEVVEIVKWKILFSARPEPVGTWTGET